MRTKLQGTHYSRNSERLRARALDRWRSDEQVQERQYFAYLLRVHGLSREAYEELLSAQGGVCGICRLPPPPGAWQKRLSVDHCHSTGRVRGLLCDRCNKSLGMFGDTVEGVRAALNYLERAEDARAK